MKLSPAHRALFALIALPVCLGGCPLDTVALPPAGDLAGTYWVEVRDGALHAYELPAQRGDEGAWHVLAVEPPAEFTGPGLYELYADGSWERLTDDEDLTLDEVIQLDDPAPAPGDPNDRPADL